MSSLVIPAQPDLIQFTSGFVTVLNKKTRFLKVIELLQLNSQNKKPGFLGHRAHNPFLVEGFFLVSFDRTIRLRIGDAGQNKSGLDLVVI